MIWLGSSGLLSQNILSLKCLSFIKKEKKMYLLKFVHMSGLLLNIKCWLSEFGCWAIYSIVMGSLTVVILKDGSRYWLGFRILANSLIGTSIRKSELRYKTYNDIEM